MDDGGGNVLWVALGLWLVLEGLFPFLSPSGWRKTFLQLLQLQDGQIRFFGLCCVLAGVLVMLVLA
jgi:uncharacterized protein YjeT (DUF2065 family)